jgi:exonuclease III
MHELFEGSWFDKVRWFEPDLKSYVVWVQSKYYHNKKKRGNRK